MRYFYELYPCAGNRPQAVDDSTIVFRIPWGHNRTIIDKCKNNVNKALFYVRKTLENNWSRDVLVNFLDTDLFERQGKAITNLQIHYLQCKVIWRRQLQRIRTILIFDITGTI